MIGFISKNKVLEIRQIERFDFLENVSHAWRTVFYPPYTVVIYATRVREQNAFADFQCVKSIIFEFSQRLENKSGERIVDFFFG